MQIHNLSKKVILKGWFGKLPALVIMLPLWPRVYKIFLAILNFYYNAKKRQHSFDILKVFSSDTRHSMKPRIVTKW